MGRVQIKKTCRCGKTFIGNSNQYGCSETCSWEISKAKKRERICVLCFKDFVGIGGQKFCKGKCLDVADAYKSRGAAWKRILGGAIPPSQWSPIIYQNPRGRNPPPCIDLYNRPPGG